MARSKKTTVNKEDKKTTKKVKVDVDKKLQEENEMLKKELEELKKMIMELKTPSVTNSKNEVIEDEIEEEPSEFVDIRPDKYIKVVSLENNPLILSTEGNGRGKIFRFGKFGETKNIVYSELANIIHHQQKFAEEGRFYIMNKDVVRNHGLIDVYKKILTKEKIQGILDYDSNTIINLFESATQAQRETIVSILIDKINNKENIDLNKIDIISRIYGENIVELAKNEIKEH